MKLNQIIVIVATIGVIAMNVLATMGKIGGVTPEIISERYPTYITPAGYAFSIWGWIYLGLIVWSILQALPAYYEKFAKVRTLYLLSCAFNILWIYFWHNEAILVSLGVILSLWATLLLINLTLERENNWIARMVFGLYLGWVTVASMVNAWIAAIFSGVTFSNETSLWLAIGIIIFATVLGIFLRHKLPNFMVAFGIAWAVTGVAVEQSGKTLIIVTAAFAVIALLISAFSFVLKDYKSPNEQR